MAITAASGLSTAQKNRLQQFDPTMDAANAIPASIAHKDDVTNVISDLASNAAGKGASCIGIEDSGGLITATTVEGALAEIAAGATPAAHAASHTDGTDDIQDATAAQKGLMTAAYATKLDGIETAADVTDATNVDAAGAVMNADTSTTAMQFVIDEDNFVSDSDTKVPTQQSVKAYVDGKVVGLYDHKGGYDANTNTPDLDTAPSGILKADTYTVSAAGTFFTEDVEVGDVLIADQDNPTLLSHWTRVNKNVSAATTTTKGIVELATDGENAADVVVQGNDSRLSDARTPTAHAASHTNGTDDIQDATAAQKGLATAAQITKLDGIEATADVTDLANVTTALGVTASAAVVTSAGGGDDGKLAKLDPNGRFDISTMPETVLKEATVVLSTANILALHTTPIELVPAPAAGLYNEFLGATVRGIFGATALNDAAAQGNLRIKTGTTAQDLAITEADGVVDVAAGTEVRHVRPAAPGATQDFEAQQESIVIDNDGGAFTDPGGADTTMSITTRYRILSLV